MALSHVQSNAANSAITSNPTVVLGAAPTEGNLLVAYVWANNTPTITAANGYAKLTEASSTDKGVLLWKLAGAGESTSQAPCTNSATIWGCVVAEYVPTAGHSIELESQTSNTDNDGTKTSTGSNDPPDGVARLVVGGAFTHTLAGTPTWSAQKVNGSTTGVNERGDTGVGSAGSCCMFDRAIASTASGNHTVEAVCSSSANGGISIAIFKTTAPPVNSPVSVSGTLTTAGALGKALSKTWTGTLTTAGALAKAISKTWTGTLTTAGALGKALSKSWTGTLTTAGANAVTRGLTAALSGTLALSGAFSRSIALLSNLSGTLTTAGALGKALSLNLGGALTTAGTLTKNISTALGGGLTTVGALTKSVALSLGGALSPSGSLATALSYVVSLAGTLLTSGSLGIVRSTVTAVLSALNSMRGSRLGRITTNIVQHRFGQQHTTTHRTENE